MNRTRWKNKTDASVMSAARAATWKRNGDHFLVGVMGFSGAWHRSGLSGAALTQYVDGITAALRAALAAQQAAHGSRLVMCSGATDIGVPGCAYRLCQEMRITAMGVTAGAAIRYRLAPMAVLVPVGRRFGDESRVFVTLCDAFVLCGGGAQSESEVRSASALSKPITVIQGFGGVADALSEEDLPGATFTQARLGA